MEKRTYGIVIRHDICEEDGGVIYSYVAEKCPIRNKFGENSCAIYDNEANFHLCPYVGEEIRVSGGKEAGVASGYCWYPELAKDRI